MVFNNVLNDRSLEQAHGKCSFYDPYIGEDAGYLQVTRLTVVAQRSSSFQTGRLPSKHTTRFWINPIAGEQSRYLPTQLRRGITFEGFYEWMVHTQAYAENEWKAARPWNPATALELAPGESKTYGLKFLLSDSIRDIEKTLAENGRPVAVGVPGYIVPQNIEARLFVKYSSKVKSTTVDPAGALSVDANGTLGAGWSAYTIHGKMWGRSRLTLAYEDGSVQTVQYFVTKPESEVVADMGRFLTSKAWYEDAKDPFHRSPSVMTYDRELNQIVMQDSRVWIAGLGDEGGGGAWLAAIMKNSSNLTKRNWRNCSSSSTEFCGAVSNLKKGLMPTECGRVSSTISPTICLLDTIAVTSTGAHGRVGTKRHPSASIAPTIIRMWRLRTGCYIAWLAIMKGLVTNHPWDWYLDHAYETSIAMTNFAAELGRSDKWRGISFCRFCWISSAKAEDSKPTILKPRCELAPSVGGGKLIRSAVRCLGIQPVRKRSMPGQNTSATKTRPK